MVYSVNLKGETNIIKTLMYAFDDAVHGVSGKAKEGRILERPQVANRVACACAGKKSLLIRYNGHMEGLGNIIKNILTFAPDMKIGISCDKCPEAITLLKEQYPEFKIAAEYDPRQYDGHLVMCDHIFKLTSTDKEDSYIDPWCNVIYSEDDFVYARSFEQTKKLFVMCKKTLMMLP